MFTKEELIENLGDVTNYTSSDTEITFSLGNK
jgi:hypothetical protein